ncbi:MAG TPA: 1,2-phenylacetyl-CoA epoxidase subunit PaaC, partial [Candidatus Dormibacteraeota bacterium]|nr:1,2-phenylacetyl-CoA epoxidase subunit PaaC [Candidatus Dormibacteraeota bacterium]
MGATQAPARRGAAGPDATAPGRHHAGEDVAAPTAAPFPVPPLRRAAPPPLNPALASLRPEVRDAYRALLLFLADSELVIGHRHSEWTGFAPSAEEDVAFSSIAQDEMGHAHLWYALLVGADDEEAVDRLALDRGPRAFRHLPLLHAPNRDWYFTTARHLYWDLFESVLLRRALESDLPLLGGAARRVLNEEQYHLEHAEQWLALLSERERPRQRLARALTRVLARAGNPAEAAPGLDALAAAGSFAS